MTSPTPPDGYELVDDEPKDEDVAWFRGIWIFIDARGNIDIDRDSFRANLIPARDLRWIARKKK